jgi:hypothetical protein
MVISRNTFESYTEETEPSGVDSLWKIARHYGLDDSWAYNHETTEFPKLPKGLVWVWLNGLDTPHWSVRGTGALI